MIAIGCATTGLALFSSHGAGHASVAAVASPLIAALWSLGYNAMFEAWDQRQAKRGRSVVRRAPKTYRTAVLVPLLAW